MVVSYAHARMHAVEESSVDLVFSMAMETFNAYVFQTGGIEHGVGIATRGTRLPRNSAVRAAPNCMAVEKPMAHHDCRMPALA